MPPEIFLNEYVLRCNVVHFETQFCKMLQWYIILFVSHDHVPCHNSVLRQEILTSCALTSLRQDDFSNIVT